MILSLYDLVLTFYLALEAPNAAVLLKLVLWYVLLPALFTAQLVPIAFIIIVLLPSASNEESFALRIRTGHFDAWTFP